MLGVRLAEGLALQPHESPPATRLAGERLLDREALRRGIARLTLDGRLMADRVARELLSTPHQGSSRSNSARTTA
jgi:hypothetical protein